MTFRSRRRGSVMVYTAVVMFVLIGFVGLAIDWGYMTWTAQKLQHTADASALAGAQQVWWSHNDARGAAMAYGALNEAGGKTVLLHPNTTNAVDGDIIIGHYNTAAKVFTPTTSRNSANAVKVIAKRTTGSQRGALPLIFGPIFNKNTAQVARYGIAVAIGGPAESSVIALNDSDPKSFYIYGNGYMDLGEGSAQVNSSSNQSSVFQGTWITFLAGMVNMVGDYNEKGNPDLNSIDLNPGEPYVADPLAGLPDPDFGSPMVPSQISGTDRLEYYPGYYPNGLSINDDNAFLHPGVYILGDGGSGKAFDHRGHGTLTGYEVMFYIDQGSVTLNGTGDVHLSPPTDGVYKGIQFFQARDNTSPAVFNGTGIFTGASADKEHAAGTLYFPEAKLTVGGTGDMYIDSLIADKIEVSGDGHKYITRGYDGRQGGDVVYLVE